MTALETLVTTAEAFADTGFLETGDEILGERNVPGETFGEVCFVQAFGIKTAERLLGYNSAPATPHSAEGYQQRGMAALSPIAGDLIFLNEAGSSCSGIVYGRNESSVFTIEGTPDTVHAGWSVSRHRRQLTDPNIGGYARADWGSMPAGATGGTDYDRLVIVTPAASAWASRNRTVTNHWTEEEVSL